MLSSTVPSRACPQCGLRLRRTRRLVADLAPQLDADLRRYRCRAASCGWTGLLPRGRHPVPVVPAVRAPGLPQRVRQGLWLLAGGAVACAVPAAVVVLMAVGHQADQAALRDVPEGVSHDGRPVPAALARPLPRAAAEPAPDGPALAVREGCAWGQPGRMPYRGTTAQALRAARLPPEVVAEVARRRAARAITDRVEIRTGAIRAVGDGREFNPRSFAMTYGHTLCVGARVNFASGHVERGDLYEVRDARGQLHAVMVPDVCGNVSVLGARGEKVDKRALTAAQAARGGPVPWVGLAADAAPRLPWLTGVRHALGLEDGGRRGGGRPGTAVRQSVDGARAVPEPGTLGVVALALVVLALQRRLSHGLAAISRRAPSSRPCASSSSSGRRPSSSSSSPASARTGSAGG